MNKVKRILSLLLALAFLSVFTQCKKDIEDLVNPTGTITFINPSFTAIDLTFNGESRSIPAGGSVVFTGNANASATGNAFTFGKTSAGVQVGLMMTWNGISQTFPSGGGNTNYTLDVGSNYFFLKVQNTSSKTIQKLYVNYGLVSQTIDNISIPNTGLTYEIGYYQAYINSNVRAESGTTFWFWNPLNLPFSNNQSKTLLAF